MVKAFGDVSFALPVGGVGVATYDAVASPYGWHVIKRLE
jgi:parvulin-like peptidyl-prolyl isomerase